MLESVLKWLGFRVTLGLLPILAVALGLALDGQSATISVATLCGRGEPLLVVCAICAGALGELLAAPKEFGRSRMVLGAGCALGIAASALGFGQIASRYVLAQPYDFTFAAWYSIAVYLAGLVTAFGAILLAEASKKMHERKSSQSSLSLLEHDVQLLREITESLRKSK